MKDLAFPRKPFLFVCFVMFVMIHNWQMYIHEDAMSIFFPTGLINSPHLLMNLCTLILV